MNEERLWTWLKPYLPQGQYTRVETGDTGPGFPDVHYQIPPRSAGTIELKVSRSKGKIPFNSETGLRESQIRWISDNLEAGGAVWIVARIGRYVFFLPGSFYILFNGSSREILTSQAKLILPYEGEPIQRSQVVRLHKMLKGGDRA